jgi:hypothetical protein
MPKKPKTEVVADIPEVVEPQEPVNDEPETKEMSVDTDCLNVRKKADGEIICQIYRNTAVTVDSVKGEWAKISKPVKGYCMVQYLK